MSEAIEGELISDEEEFQDALERLEEQFPSVVSQGFDFNQLTGKPLKRTAKAIVLHLALHGKEPGEIAEMIGKARSDVYMLFRDALAEAAPLEDVELLRSFELAKLRRQEEVTWEDYAASRAEGPGNPAYQKLLLEIGKRRDSLLGLAKPTQISVSKETRALKITEVVVKTHEEYMAMKNAGLLK